MPLTNCPSCGREIQFPDYFGGTRVACPNAQCGRPVPLPNADGSLPAEPTSPRAPAKPRPAEAYYLRRPADRDLVVGPLPRAKLRQLAARDQLRQTDEISDDGRTWQQAAKRDPALFRDEDARACPACGALVAESEDRCAACARQDPACGRAAGTYGLGAAVAARPGRLNPRVERVLTAPKRLSDFASARAADATFGASDAGWLGLWRVADGRLEKAWEFPAGDVARLAVADPGNRAVVAVEYEDRTRLYLADFEYRKLRELTDLDRPPLALSLSPDGAELSLVDDEPDVRVYRLDPWKRLDRFPVEGDRFAFCPVGERLAAAHDRGAVILWDVRAGKVERELYGPGDDPACPQLPLRMGFSRTGKRFFAATSQVVHLPKTYCAGINPVAAYLLGGVPFYLINANLSVIQESIASGKIRELLNRLEDETALRVWTLDRGRVLNDEGGLLLEHHPTGFADGAFWAGGS
ncbi:MAG TPA: hypothetical protein VM597_32105, partial [Gemmataceae bacterium]|nr:hypothetical protein [Gemmataceae bacterium]